MRAGPVAVRAPQHSPNVSGPRPGHTRVTPRALTRLLEAIAAEAFSVSAAGVKARIEDDKGLLRVSVAVSVAVPPLLANPAATGESLYDRAATARASIITHAQHLAGTTVNRVDIRLTGIHQEKEVRVR